MDITTAYESENLMDAEQVATYLLENPEFFTQFPHIIEKINIPHTHKGSVSLVELQSEQLLNGSARHLKKVPKGSALFASVFASAGFA